MTYFLTILALLGLGIVQCILILLKSIGVFTIAWGVILIPCWFLCAAIVVAAAIWLFTLFM